MECVVNYTQTRLSVLAIYIAAKDGLAPSISNKMERFSFKVGVPYGWKMTKCVTSYSQDNAVMISHLYSSKRHFICPPLVIRWSALF